MLIYKACVIHQPGRNLLHVIEQWDFCGMMQRAKPASIPWKAGIRGKKSELIIWDLIILLYIHILIIKQNIHPANFPIAILAKGPWELSIGVREYWSIWRARAGFVRVSEQEHLEGKEGAFPSRATSGCPVCPPQPQLAQPQSFSFPPHAIAIASYPQPHRVLLVTYTVPTRQWHSRALAPGPA